MTNYYKDTYIYENIIIKYVNSRNDKDLISLIRQKTENHLKISLIIIKLDIS